MPTRTILRVLRHLCFYSLDWISSFRIVYFNSCDILQFQMPTDEYHIVTPLKHAPACYMYIFVDKSQDEKAGRKKSSENGEDCSPLSLYTFESQMFDSFHRSSCSWDTPAYPRHEGSWRSPSFQLRWKLENKVNLASFDSFTWKYCIEIFISEGCSERKASISRTNSQSVLFWDSFVVPSQPTSIYISI